MDKISKAQVIEVLEKVGGALRQVTNERDEALAKLAAYEKRYEAEKVASIMIEKGVTNEPFERVVEQMEKAAETYTEDGLNQLAVIKAGLEISGPDMGEKIARIIDDYNDRASSISGTDFERYIVGDIG
jgi:hypothetical protein